jgi:hypothetical protein
MATAKQRARQDSRRTSCGDMRVFIFWRLFQ